MKKPFFLQILAWLAISCNLHAQSQFTNNGNIKLHSGTNITFFGDFINNGSLVDSANVITLAGISAQAIGGASLTTFKNLTLNNSAGSYFTANEQIIGALNITAGTFSTTGYDFTLVSNANGTARIAPILGDFAGNITMQRYISPGVSDWRFLASPVSGVTINDWQDDFVTSGFPGSTYPNYSFNSIYTYDETVGGIYDFGYNGATSAGNPIVPGTGYWCYLGPVPLTIDVTGPPIKFNQTFSVTYSPSAGPSQDGYVMIGNPYPSPIDWNSGSWTKNNINNAIYIWNPANQQYASWVSGTGVNGGSNIIASSQSFWVQTNAANPILSCNENIKSSTDQPFLRSQNQTTFNTLKLSLKGNGFTDESVIRFGANATNDYDNQFDARKVFSSSFSVPSLSSFDSTQTDMSINSFPVLSNTISVPIRAKVGVSGVYAISSDSSSTLDGFCIVLEDLLTGIKTNMANAATYTFNISDTTNVARFRLHVSSSTIVHSFAAKCFASNNGIAVAKGKGTGPWNYIWLNNLNNIIQTSSNSFAADTLFNLSAGNYTVNVNDVNGFCGQQSSSLSISQPDQILANFVISHNNILVNVDSLLLLNTSANASFYQWNFGDNSPVLTTQNPPNHIYAATGQYSVTLIAATPNCSDKVTKIVTVFDAAGISENNLNTKIVVFPNPSNGIFYVNLKNLVDENADILVYTVSGQTIYKSKLHSGQNEIDLRQFPKGIYFYTCNLMPGQSINGKLIVD